MRFDLLTIFPDFFAGAIDHGIIRRARQQGQIGIEIHDLRSFTDDRHHIVDDRPFGGGDGMVLKPEPIFRGVETLLAGRLPGDPEEPTAIVLLTPQGRVFNQREAARLAVGYKRLIFICGRYEGVDERVLSQLVTDEISIGDYVLSGGELAAMVIVDAVTRLLPGALGYELGAHHDSHSPGLDGLLEGPQYTRPPTFRGETVPAILLSGHHANVNRWRREQALLRTLQRRPELLAAAPLSQADIAFLRRHGWLS